MTPANDHSTPSGAADWNAPVPDASQSTTPPFLASELDAASFPEWRDRILGFEGGDDLGEPRSYPGYPRWRLPAAGERVWPPLDRVLARRRSSQAFTVGVPSRRALSRLLRGAHGVTAAKGRGPVPSAGGLQALELYLVAFEASWLPAGAYHFDRVGNHLSQLLTPAPREDWVAMVPSMERIQGGGVLFVLVGDYRRVAAKYGDRALRFLLLEAGHLGQNLCLLATSLGLGALALGGYFERAIARRLALPPGDEVLYLVLCGKVGRNPRPAAE